MSGWKRAHPVAGRAYIDGFFAIGSTVVTVVVVVIWLATGSGPLAEEPWTIGLAAAFITFFWRHFIRGVYVGDRGVRLTRIFSTQVVPWNEIADFDVRDFSENPGKVLSLWVIRKSKPPIEAPVVRHSWTHFFRLYEYFAAPVPPRDFDRMVDDLRRRLGLSQVP